MQTSAHQPQPPRVQDHPILLQRISRELDRFLVQLTQIEAVTADLISNTKETLPDDTSKCLQSVDYISQTSMSLSMLLTTMSQNPEAPISVLVKDVRPNDLRNRLLDRLLHDIDNTGNEIEVF